MKDKSRNSSLKILIWGHAVVDKIFTTAGKEIKPGGIYFSVAAFVSAKSQNDFITLKTELASKYENLFYAVFSKIDQSYVERKMLMPVNRLYLSIGKEREEVYEYIPQPMKFDQNIDFTLFDGIFLNMVTGFDIELEELKQIRKLFKKQIYIDIHTLSRGVDDANNRYFRNIPKIDEWLKCVDIVQVNEFEIFTISDEKSEIKIAADILEKGVTCLIVTKGKRGATIYYQGGSEIAIKTIELNHTTDNNCVGCGDIFGALFFYSYLEHRNFEKSLAVAVRGSSFYSRENDITELIKKQNDIFK